MGKPFLEACEALIDPREVIGLTVVDLLGDGEALVAAEREFDERTGGEIGGEDWIPPLCDHEPPIHFRWPEYVTTERGEEWWIPAIPDLADNKISYKLPGL
jgi:aminobenzoyl-glutamate utilization protein B